VFDFSVVFQIDSFFFYLDLGRFIFKFGIFYNKFLDSGFKFFYSFFTLFIFNINNFFLNLNRDLNNLSIGLRSLNNRLFLCFLLDYILCWRWARYLDLLIMWRIKILNNFSLSNRRFWSENFLCTLLNRFSSRLASILLDLLCLLLYNNSLRLTCITLKTCLKSWIIILYTGTRIYISLSILAWLLLLNLLILLLLL
jgi:hypothetical protein